MQYQSVCRGGAMVAFGTSENCRAHRAMSEFGSLKRKSRGHRSWVAIDPTATWRGIGPPFVTNARPALDLFGIEEVNRMAAEEANAVDRVRPTGT